MTAHIFYADGGIELPFEAHDVDSTELSFGAADPVSAALLSLFEAALNAELTAAWTVVCAALPSDAPLYNSTTPVADTLADYPYPSTILTRKSGWPLLCLNRDGEAEEDDTFSIETPETKQNWQLHWILGPLGGVGSELKLGGVDLIAKATIKRVCRYGSHPAHNSGVNQLIGDTLEGPHLVGSLRLLRSKFRQAVFATGREGESATYWTLLSTLETTDYWTELSDAYGAFEGVQITAGVGDRYQVIPALIETDSDCPGTMYDPDGDST